MNIINYNAKQLVFSAQGEKGGLYLYDFLKDQQRKLLTEDTGDFELLSIFEISRYPNIVYVSNSNDGLVFYS